MPKKEEEPGAKLVRYGMGILIGSLIALGVCLLLLLAASAAVSAGYLREEDGGRLTAAACLLGTLVGGFWAVRRCGARALIIGAATGGALFLLPLTVGMLAFQASPWESGGLLLLCAALCGGASAGILARTAQPKKKRRK